MITIEISSFILVVLFIFREILDVLLWKHES